MHVYDVSYHLWSNEYFTKIGNEVGEAIAVDPCSISFTKLDAVRIKVRSEQTIFNFDSVRVSEGVTNYRPAIFPDVFADEVKLGVDCRRWPDMTGTFAGENR